MRSATAADHAAIRVVTDAAFGPRPAAATYPAESDIIEGVRAEGAVLIELVAEADGEVVGHVLFSRMTVTPPRLLAALGPVAVRPDAQGRGHGEALCRAGIEALRALGVEAVVVLGRPTYYPRFGFSHAAAKTIASPYAERPAFMAMEMAPGALGQPLKADYPVAFG